ncbi:GH36-type glycosyl hydrolase domain-containing protein [Methylocapsa acidiphila]|uniref:GH36-type glycosyl hydrolase domain-containing protein n=1 Tax=Methylocapsa acidiphila TaxID=133552 RepID=UPI00041A34B6|nr:cellobiose phosphorylase [Methylocapsa acidiphila]
MPSRNRIWKTPRERDLGLRWISNRAGLAIGVLPNGRLFAIENRRADGAIMINQLLGSPIADGISRLYLRSGGAAPAAIDVLGSAGASRFGTGPDRFAWEGETNFLLHRATLSLHPEAAAWMWRLEAMNVGAAAVPLDAVLIQDLGLGDRGFLMNNEAYASQYIDHHIERRPGLGPVIMSRQNLAQSGRHPWVLHACLDGAKSFATDGLQLFGPGFRDQGDFAYAFGADLPNMRLQHELASAAIQSAPRELAPGAAVEWRFLGLYEPDHPTASSASDLARIDALAWPESDPAPIVMAAPARSIIQEAPAAIADALTPDDVAERRPERFLEEHENERLLSFFCPDAPLNRHVALRDKELLVTRRHGAILRSGQAMLPDEATLCATCWMHGVFAAQLTIGNTSFHKLLSVSRDPYNITRASGLRMLIDFGDGWRLLTVPSLFEIGLSDCRWVYRFGARVVELRAAASGEDPAMQWRVTIEGEACRLLIFGHLVLGERELDHAGDVEVDATAMRLSFRPDADSLWGKSYPDAIYHLVTSAPEAIEAIGGDELLFSDGVPRDGAYFALRTRPIRAFKFALVGSLTNPEAADRLAEKYRSGVAEAELLAPAADFWRRVTRGLRLDGGDAEGAALDAAFPWLAHDAMIHLTVPHGLEQYAGAAWGTRDVCQGPVEFLLALEHDEPVKEILRIVFAQQYESRGDWPQWFMLEPYSFIQDKTSHGDVIIWPLKALNDYIEATHDLAFLDEPVAWRREDNFARTERKDTIAAHIEKLLAALRERFIPGTHLVKYGEGDWNDSLQPADPRMRDWMASSWTVSLLHQQLNRYADILWRIGQADEASALHALAARMREDVNRYLIRDGAIAGYGLFDAAGGEPELLLHPSDARTGLKYSLLPMIQSITGGLFTPEQQRSHHRLIRDFLLFPDGARLIDRPIVYRGGVETTFRRAESSAFFGREIGLMYVHAHLRYAEAMAALGDQDAVWDALQLANPIAATDRLPRARLRQRNAYFSSSDAAFPDRYAASAEWARVKVGDIALEGGWRVYSSGPGLYVSVLLRHVLGLGRTWDEAGESRAYASLRGVAATLDPD